MRKYLGLIPYARPLVRAMRRAVGPRARQKRVAAYWDRQIERAAAAPQPRSWLDSPFVVREYIEPQFGGRDWWRYLRERYCEPPRQRALSLCCGDGDPERAGARARLFHACEGIDISPEAIAACQRAAEPITQAALHYRVGDVEQVVLPAERYDIAFGWMGLHHLRTLPHVFAQVKRALRPEGVFVTNEYVGPARLQVPASTIALVEEGLAMLPEELRRTPAGTIRGRFVPATAAEVEAADPSEAVSSEQILPLLEREFRVLERIDYGGAVLLWVLHDLVQNFDPEERTHTALLHRLFEFERSAMRQGLVGSNFSFVVATHPTARGGQEADRPV